MGNYSTDPDWADINPIPTDEGGPNPLAAIAYSEEYSETMSYLRAVMAANEFSPRVLKLTEDLIDMNPAHYTVWLYRARCLFTINADLREELKWLNETALEHQKNYQIWHHRQMIVDRLDDCQGEGKFVERMFEKDAKNYHVWCYRQWMVRRFGLWGEENGELDFVERCLEKDVRNNSAWNHRWFVVNGQEGSRGVLDERVRETELEFAKKAIERAPQNECPWNYLKGVVGKSGVGMGVLKEFTGRYAGLGMGEEVRSSYALELMAEIFADEENGKDQAVTALDMLAQKYDPIRKNYWEYRKEMLDLPSAAA
jgi:protein farnesyltransferase/geranylgeranyltransferase type-1 subunit alpha